MSVHYQIYGGPFSGQLSKNTVTLLVYCASADVFYLCSQRRSDYLCVLKCNCITALTNLFLQIAVYWTLRSFNRIKLGQKVEQAVNFTLLSFNTVNSRVKFGQKVEQAVNCNGDWCSPRGVNTSRHLKHFQWWIALCFRKGLSLQQKITAVFIKYWKKALQCTAVCFSKYIISAPGTTVHCKRDQHYTVRLSIQCTFCISVKCILP